MSNSQHAFRPEDHRARFDSATGSTILSGGQDTSFLERRRGGKADRFHQLCMNLPSHALDPIRFSANSLHDSYPRSWPCLVADSRGSAQLPSMNAIACPSNIAEQHIRHYCGWQTSYSLLGAQLTYWTVALLEELPDANLARAASSQPFAQARWDVPHLQHM